MNFLDELNSELGPMLFAEESPNGIYRLKMKESPFLHGVMLNVSGYFKATVERLGKKHFGSKPIFNNTETTWWF